MSEFIKVSHGDARTQNIDLSHVKPINNIKVIREEEESVSSESVSSYSGESNTPKKKRTKKVLRKKEPQQHAPQQHRQQQHHDFGAFSNPKKVSKRDYEPSESEYTDGSSEQSDDYSEQSDDSERNEKPVETFEEKQKMKQDLLIKIAALEKKGFEFTKKFTMASNYEEMMFEYTKIKKFIETQASIKFARRCLMACVTGVEFLNKKFDPFSIKLEGWSENIMENVDDYDNVFEKLYEKYSSKAEVAPEIELLLMVGGSAFMFHLTNSLLKGPMMGNILAQNVNFGNNTQSPNFMASMMGAMNEGMKEMNKPPHQQQQNQQQKPNFPPPMETRGIRKEMRGPTLDSNLFNGTPLATNYPNPPSNHAMPPPQPRYYEDNPINDDDRFSLASDDSSVSSVSVESTRKTLTINASKGFSKKKGTGGLELNIK